LVDLRFVIGSNGVTDDPSAVPSTPEDDIKVVVEYIKRDGKKIKARAAFVTRILGIPS
jgi:hypothetical protein